LKAVDQPPRTCESKGPQPSQLLFSTNNQEMTKISGQKYAFSNVASDDTLELYFCRPSLLLRNKIFQHVLLLSLELQKIIEEEKKCDENAKVFGAEISLNDISVGQKSPSCLSLAGCCQACQVCQACQLVRLVMLVRLSTCQACQLVRLVRLAESCQWSPATCCQFCDV